MIMFWIFAGITALGVAGYVLQMVAVRSFIAAASPGGCGTSSRELPPVSILKPLKGLDDGLFDNLQSFCTLDYPNYEIIFALQNRNDPACKVAEKIKGKYPALDISIVVEYCDEGLNPKVNNLIPAYEKAKHELILISDSNVRAEKNYLKDIAAQMADPSVGLVSNMIKGVGGRSAGAILENLHLNSFIVGSVCFLDKYLGLPCVIGKSMLLRKRDLDAIGGFVSVKDILAEDYIIGERIHEMGKKVVLSNHVIHNVNEYWGIRRFLNRHTRWGKLRWHIGGVKYLSELIGNAVFIAALSFVFCPVNRMSVSLAASVSAIKVARDFYIGRKLEAGLNPLLYLLTPVKDLLIGFIWFVPLLSSRVVWRGNKYIIAKDSRLFPCTAAVGHRWGHGILSVIRTKLAPART